MVKSGNQEENASKESFSSMFEESLKVRDGVKEGDIVKGEVVAITRDHVVVDIGYKSEGTIAIHEFTSINGVPQVKAGDKIDVFVESREDEHGHVVLSKEKADKLKVWDEISAAAERDELVEGVIVARVKG